MPPPIPSPLAKLWGTIVPARGLALTFPHPSADTIKSAVGFPSRLCRDPTLSALPPSPLQPAAVTLAKVPFLPVTAFPGSAAPLGFSPTRGPPSHPQCRRRPHRHPAAHARDGARGARTKPGPSPGPEMHLQKAVWTLQAGEAWGGALRVLVWLPGCSGPCRRPGA